MQEAEKLQKILARSGHGSRREIEAKMQAGRISVNGEVAHLGMRLDDKNATVRIDGHIVSIAEESEQICRVLAYYKPEGEICTRQDPEGRPTVFERLPRLNNARWINIGRLDINTSGLMLFTTDGELANRLMHPQYQLEREYLVRIFGEINEENLDKLVNGVQLDDGMARFEHIVPAGGEGRNQNFYVVITEGRNREVRRLWESQEVKVSRLKRVRYGPIFLDTALPKGGWMELTLAEFNPLRELVGLAPETKTMMAIETKKNNRTQRRNQIQKIRRAVHRRQR